jgi:uncharacterized coiled-coil DUF342 family protein
MQEMRTLLQQTIQVQNQTVENINRLEGNIDRLEQAQARTQQQLNQTQDIANSNARSVQAWEALINENRDEAEEERSVLRVTINELAQASRENIAQHIEFRARFDQVMNELEELRRNRG